MIYKHTHKTLAQSIKPGKSAWCGKRKNKRKKKKIKNKKKNKKKK